MHPFQSEIGVLLMLVVAAYGAGWASHRWYVRGSGSLVGPVPVEFSEGGDVIDFRRPEGDVERAMKLIAEIEKNESVNSSAESHQDSGTNSPIGR